MIPTNQQAQPDSLAVKRYELLTHLRYLGYSGPLAMQMAVNTTEQDIDATLQRARDQIKGKLS